MTKKKKTIRVAPTIPEDVLNNLKCYNITTRDALINYSNDLKYGKETTYRLDSLEYIKSYLEADKEKTLNKLKEIEHELANIDQEIKNVQALQEKMDKEIEDNIIKAQEDIKDLLRIQYDAYNNENFTRVIKIKFKDIEAIADKYNVPVKRALPKEDVKDFYKITLEDYEKHIPGSYFYEK